MAFYSMKEYLEYRKQLQRTKEGFEPNPDYFEIRNRAPPVSRPLKQGIWKLVEDQKTKKIYRHFVPIESRDPKWYGIEMERIKKEVRNREPPSTPETKDCVLS